jgi:HlyD family secretion protein
MMKTLALLVATALAGLALFALYRNSERNANGGRADATLTGTVEAREVDVAPEIAGRIVKLAVDEGQRVKKGDELVTLDDELIRLRIARLEATLATVKAEVENLKAPSRWSTIKQQQSKMQEAAVALDEAKAAFQRATSMHQRGATSQVEVVSADYAVRSASQRLETERNGLRAAESGARPTEIQAAEARVAEQEREIDLAKLDLKRTHITAPMDGLVVRRHYDVGELVSPGTPIFTVLNTASMWIELAADERVHGGIAVGQPAEIRPEAFPGQRITGHVTFVADRHSFTPKAAQTRDDRAMLTFRVKVGVDEGQELIKPGMYVDVTLQPPQPPRPPQQ